MATTNERILVTATGGPSVLGLVSEAMPQPGPGEVRLRVLTAGVAFADILVREGIYPGVRVPVTPGYDVIAEVEATGPGVSEPAVGSRVAALIVTGAYARHVCVPADLCVPVPADTDPVAGVALVLNYLTAWQMLTRCAHVVEGDTILVHGAAGGVGTALLELARLRGLRAFGTASAGKHGRIRDLGAEAIDYRREDFVARVNAAGGAHAVFDHVGGRHLGRSFAATRPAGTTVVYGFYAGTKGGRADRFAMLKEVLLGPRFDTVRLLMTSKGATGYTVTAWRDQRRGLYRADLGALFGLLADGSIAPVIAQVLPLREAARAHELLGGAQVEGKIVLDCTA